MLYFTRCITRSLTSHLEALYNLERNVIIFLIRLRSNQKQVNSTYSYSVIITARIMKNNCGKKFFQICLFSQYLNKFVEIEFDQIKRQEINNINSNTYNNNKLNRLQLKFEE